MTEILIMVINNGCIIQAFFIFPSHCTHMSPLPLLLPRLLMEMMKDDDDADEHKEDRLIACSLSFSNMARID